MQGVLLQDEVVTSPAANDTDRINMLDKISEYITANKMIEPGDRIVVGVSGGADSVCLLHALRRLCRDKEAALIAVHVNHGIRGEEADRDEQYVEQLCNRWGVEFYRYGVNVRQLAAEQGLSEEEAGRKVRYEAFLEICSRQKCNKIAVAHNKNDNAETVLFNLFRGTGLKGLSGISPKRSILEAFGEILLIRPLLCLERKEIEELLEREDIAYRTDSSNLTEDYTRNKIRSRILKFAAEEINSGAVGNINEAALKLSQAAEYIDSQVALLFHKLVRREKKGYSINADGFLKAPEILQQGLVRLALEKLADSRKDLETKHVEAIIGLTGKQVGKRLHLPYNITAERGYGDIKLYPAGEGNTKAARPQMEPIPVKIPGHTVIPQIHKILETKLINYEKIEPIPKSSCMKWIDYDKIENAVEIRSRKEGDYIQINESGGSKRLKDYFIDQKIPQELRDSQILITDGSHVVWIPGAGERMSEKYKVEPTTKNILLMNLLDLEEKKNDRQRKSNDIGGTGK